MDVMGQMEFETRRKGCKTCFLTKHLFSESLNITLIQNYNHYTLQNSTILFCPTLKHKSITTVTVGSTVANIILVICMPSLRLVSMVTHNHRMNYTNFGLNLIICVRRKNS